MAYKSVPLAIFYSLFGGIRNLAFNDLGFGLIDQFKKKQSMKAHCLEMIHSRRWRYPFRFATVVAGTLAISIWLIRNYTPELHITATNRSYLVLTTLLVIVPTQGSTISRGLHRMLGTILGVFIGYLVSWAALTAGGIHDSSRWLVMQFVLPVILFFGIIIQLIPGTGYAALLFNITVPLVSVAYFNTPIDRVPLSVPITRVIFIAVACVWCVAAFCALVPVRSVNNLRLSLLNCLSTSGKAFTTIVECGLLHDRAPIQLLEEEIQIVSESLSTLNTANNLHKLLLLDTWFETLHQRYLHHDYREAVNHTRNLIQKLILIQTLYDDGFSEAVTKFLIIPLRPNIQFILKPISARVTKVAEQRAQLALRRSTSRATKIKKVPHTVREKMKERRKRKQLTHEARKKEKERRECKQCHELKDCEVHRHGNFMEEMRNFAENSAENGSTASSPAGSSPKEGDRRGREGESVESPVVEREEGEGDKGGEEEGDRKEEGEDSAGEGGSGGEVPPMVPSLKVPTKFEDLQENFQQLRNHAYRTRKIADATLNERAEHMRFFALIRALGQFARDWEEMRQTMIRLGLAETKEEILAIEKEEEELEEKIEVALKPPLVIPEQPIIEAELETQLAAVGVQPPALAGFPPEVELQILQPSEVQCQVLRDLVRSQQQDEVSIMSEENKGGVVS
eukprot:Phypoly_transcript_03927.p1 GENE.Phypoly_transcript_03927~~Phypoly_transcript_03927.p1  ORF type:complete len:681 (+),score=108.98 Phypoly_transcript_03927:222-2264(+)